MARLTLNAIAGEVIRELDADGRGFTARAAVPRIIDKVCEDGACDEWGVLRKLPMQLMRLGANQVVRDYKPIRENASVAAGGQGDFQDVAPDFTHWLADYAALSEDSDAPRMQWLSMDYNEFVRALGLLQAKAEVIQEHIRLAQVLLADHPEWPEQPWLTLAQIVGDEA
jgi:hypothetical protein